jgi:DNA-binding NtrC family response regulator
VIERSLIVNESENFTVDSSWLVRGTHDPQAETQLLSGKLRTQEKAIIEAALAESGGRVAGPSGAAAKLSIPVSTLESKIKSLKIAKHRFKPN